MPLWQGIALSLLLFISITETAYLFYVTQLMPPVRLENTYPYVNQTCTFHRDDWYCCDVFYWGMVNTSKGKVFTITDCQRYTRINQTR